LQQKTAWIILLKQKGKKIGRLEEQKGKEIENRIEGRKGSKEKIE